MGSQETTNVVPYTHELMHWPMRVGGEAKWAREKEKKREEEGKER
jgi:hypothetical protein